MAEFIEVIQEYADKFGAVPSFAGLSEPMLAKAQALLEEAIELDVPYEGDEDFYEALGVDPPPTDEDVLT